MSFQVENGKIIKTHLSFDADKFSLSGKLTIMIARDTQLFEEENLTSFQWIKNVLRVFEISEWEKLTKIDVRVCISCDNSYVAAKKGEIIGIGSWFKNQWIKKGEEDKIFAFDNLNHSFYPIDEVIWSKKLLDEKIKELEVLQGSVPKIMRE